MLVSSKVKKTRLSTKFKTALLVTHSFLFFFFGGFYFGPAASLPTSCSPWLSLHTDLRHAKSVIQLGSSSQALERNGFLGNANHKSLAWFKAIFGGIPLLNHHLGWPWLRVVINCPDDFAKKWCLTKRSGFQKKPFLGGKLGVYDFRKARCYKFFQGKVDTRPYIPCDLGDLKWWMNPTQPLWNLLKWQG